MNQAEKHQKGGVVSFVIVGVVLLSLLVGGVYLSKQHGRIASRTGTTPTPVKVDENNLKQNNTDQKQPASENKSSGNTNNQTNNSSNQPAQNNTPTQQQPPRSNTSTPPAVANTGPSHIASTGPGDFLVVAIGLGVLAGGFGFYRQSATRMQRAALDSRL